MERATIIPTPPSVPHPRIFLMFTRQTVMTLAALSALGFAAFSQPAAAQSANPDPDAVSVRVEFRDLNIDSQAGAATLMHRIRHAVKVACGDNGNDKLNGVSQTKACVKDSTDRAVAFVNAPILTALNGGHVAAGAELATSRP